MSESRYDKKYAVHNKHYDADLHHVLKMTKWLLTPLGLWLLVSRNPTKNHMFMSITAIIACMSTIMWVIIPCSRHLIFIEKDHNVRLTKMGPVSYCYKSVLLYGALILSTVRIKRCIEHIREDWKNLRSDEDRQIMLRNINIGRKITLICGIFMYTGGLSYHSIMPIWSGNKINNKNQTIRPHVYPGYDDFVNSQATPAYELIFISQFITALVACNITTASCNLTVIVVAHAVGQIQIVMARVRCIVDDNNCEQNAKPDQRIAVVIRSHVNVLRLTAEIEKVLKDVCLVEIFGSTMVMCLVEYYSIKEWNNSESIVLFTYIMLFFSLSFNIFLFCKISEVLTQQWSDIGKLAYMINWYRLPGKTGLPLTLIIAIAQCPRRLSAGGLLELSMKSFALIMRTSVAYLNLLYTMES